MCSWDEKSSVKIHKALEQEITLFISEAQKVHQQPAIIGVYCVQNYSEV